MIEIVDQNSQETCRHIADKIRKISREIMISEEVHDLFDGRVVDISVTDKGTEILNYDQIVIYTEVRVSKKGPMGIRLIILTDLDDPSDTIVYAIGHGSLNSLRSSVPIEVVRSSVPIEVVKDATTLQSVYESYREVLMDALRELAS